MVPVDDREQFARRRQVSRVSTTVNPDDLTASGNERRAGQLQYIAMFLEGPAEAYGTPCRTCFFTPVPEGRWCPQDPPPRRSFETHRSIALAFGIADTDSGHTVTPAEFLCLRSRSLHNARYPYASLLEIGQSIAQLREDFHIERSAKVPQP